ncbi:hypothetical protein TNCV_2998141 [Trichonephila clavipes]|nr:hypothetical protein TNCV_2998141 [Trichonephila clavipes]
MRTFTPKYFGVFSSDIAPATYDHEKNQRLDCEAPARGCPCSPLPTRPVSVGKDEESRKSFIVISVY